MLRGFSKSAFAFATVVALFALRNSQAQTSWTAGTGAWEVPGNWTAGVPVATQDFFINSGTAQISTGINGVGRFGTLAENSGDTGAIEVSGGTLTIGNVTAGAGTAAFTLDGGTLRLSQGQAALWSGFAENQVIFAAGGATIDTQGFDATTSAGITGSGALEKLGPGTLTFTGVSDFAGPATISEGAIMIDESGFLESSVTVKAGASFGGDGSVNGAVVMEDGAMLIPIDCFDTGGDVTWHAGAGMTSNLGAFGGSDILEVGGNFTKAGSGSYAFSFGDAGWEIGGTYLLVVFTDTDFLASDFSFTNGGGFDGYFTKDDTTVSFTVTAIPEPTTATLAALGLIVAAARRKQRA